MTVIYTYTDEAPALATHSFLPVIEAFAGAAGVDVELRDISLSGRILAAFELEPDALAELGELARTPDANIIKLPNISASIPQLKAAIKELQDAGYDLPEYEDARETYDTVKGSAVNPVLREGNSDRRAPAAVKQFARNHPHSMGAWSPDSRTHVATMREGDFRSTETSVTLDAADELRIEHLAADGTVTVLRDGIAVLEGEIVDAAVMRRAALDAFLAEQVEDAKAQGVLFSVHLKATMMKVSDPIIFGHAVRAYFKDLFAAHRDLDPEQRRRQPPGGGAGRGRARVRDRPGARHGRLRPRDHQPARPERRDHRRLDAGDDPDVGPDVEPRRRAAGRQGGDPRLQLRGALRGDDRLLPRARRVRSRDDGHDAERRPDGAEGGGVRQPRQDVRDRGGRHGARRGPRGRDAARAGRRAR